MSLDPIAVLAGHQEDRVWHASWSHSGHFLASCGEDKTIRIWRLVKDESLSVFYVTALEDAQTRTLRSCEWSPDDSMIASASFDGTVVIWECQNSSGNKWDQMASLEGHDNEVKSVSWSGNGNWLATCGRDKKIWIWEKLRGEFECVAVLESHTQDVKFVRWHPHDESVLFSCSYDDTIKVWKEDNEDWYCFETLTAHSSTVWGICPSIDGSKMVSCSDDRTLILWDCDGVAGKGTFRNVSSKKELHDFPIYSIDWSRLHGYIASGGGDNMISICSVDDLQLLRVDCQVKAAHLADVNCVRWNPSEDFGKILLSTGDDGLIRLWQLNV